MDQPVAAGIGNVHRREVLGANGVDSWRPRSDLSDEQLRHLYEDARAGLRREAEPGPQRHAVHGRAGRPCQHCGTPVDRLPHGPLGRLTYWRPRCQA